MTTAPHPLQRNRRILVIDDMETIHQDFRKILSPPDAGAASLDTLRASLFGKPSARQPIRFTLDSAFQGEEAAKMLRAALEANQPYAAAFVDMRMPPGWDGLETIMRLWEIDPRLEIVVCTAYSDHSWEEMVEKLGQTDQLLLLKKPFDNAEVSQLACALTEKWNLARQAQMQRSDLEKEVQGRTEELATKARQLENEIAVRMLAQQRLVYNATHDALTGLANRVALMEALSAEAASSGFAVLFLDMDNFKYVNDSLGHRAGDDLLIQAVGRLSAALAGSHQQSLIARLGGDEFVILLKPAQTVDDAISVAERINQQFASPFMVRGQDISVSMSIGIAMAEHGKNAEALLRDADTALYRAKTTGKARHAVFDEAMHREVLGRLEMENCLRCALERNQFEVLYQPIIALDSNRICGFEALTRWNHPTRGVISPAMFIPLAEEIGAIVPLGHWVLEQACQQLRQWNDGLPPDQRLSMSVNISRLELNESGFVEKVARLLTSNGLSKGDLNLEITESVIMQNPNAMRGVLKRVRDLGVGIHMDDFGTGHSSLSCLHTFPINTLKIDRSFISMMGDNRPYVAIIHAIVTVADNLGLNVVAEGIETQDQLAQVLALDCRYGQGYLFSKPVSAEEASRMIEKRVVRMAA